VLGPRDLVCISNMQNRFRVFTGFGSCQGFRKPGKEKSKGLAGQGLVNVYYLGSRFPTKDT